MLWDRMGLSVVGWGGARGMFCLSSLEMLSPASTVSPIKDVPDSQ